MRLAAIPIVIFLSLYICVLIFTGYEINSLGKTITREIEERNRRVCERLNKYKKDKVDCTEKQR